MFRVSRVLVFIYIVVGVFVAWEHHYITLAWLRTFSSVLLSVLLWFLVLLGVNLHVH
jgi:hypothetical protein